jgi:hypothetical protein
VRERLYDQRGQCPADVWRQHMQLRLQRRLQSVQWGVRQLHQRHAELRGVR